MVGASDGEDGVDHEEDAGDDGDGGDERVAPTGRRWPPARRRAHRRRPPSPDRRRGPGSRRRTATPRSAPALRPSMIERRRGDERHGDRDEGAAEPRRWPPSVGGARRARRISPATAATMPTARRSAGFADVEGVEDRPRQRGADDDDAAAPIAPPTRRRSSPARLRAGPARHAERHEQRVQRGDEGDAPQPLDGASRPRSVGASTIGDRAQQRRDGVLLVVHPRDVVDEPGAVGQRIGGLVVALHLDGEAGDARRPLGERLPRSRRGGRRPRRRATARSAPRRRRRSRRRAARSCRARAIPTDRPAG